MLLAKGLPLEEAQRLEQERITKLKASRARTMALRKEREALSAGLGDAAVAAKVLDKTKKALSRELRVNPNKGVAKPTTVIKRVLKRREDAEREKERQENPMIRGLAGVPGVEVNSDGLIGLRDLRKQRPDIFEMEPQRTELGKIYIAKKLKASGRKDKYGYVLEPGYTPGSGKIPGQVKEE